jgi:Uncharacterised nucleotidyltransferase
MSPDAIRLILRLARRDPAAIARCLDAGAPPATLLVEQALAGGLAVVLLRALAEHPSSIELTEGDLARLHQRQQRQEARSTILLGALAGVADTFTSAGQPFMLLKGPYHALRFYGDVAGREYVDFDLLVPAGDRLRASRLLESSGYIRRSRMVAGPAVTGCFVHGFDFAAGQARLDLHWCLSRHPSIRVDEARLWADRTTCTVGGGDYAALSDEHEIVFAALSLLRDIERGRPKAKNVIDLVQLAAAADAGLDWNAVLERARREGTHGPLVNVLSLCLDVADARDLAPRLGAALEGRARRAPCGAAADPFTFRPAALGLGNKWWSARAHDTSLAAWVLWWAASLPFRIAVHRRPGRGATRHVTP